MKRPLVGYGTGPRNSVDEQAAERWARDHDYAGVLWRRDGASSRQHPADQRHGLHQALFCLRADFANGLWLTSWDHLGDPTTRELVCAEVWANGGEVVVDEQIVEPDGAVPAEQQMLRDLAQAGRRLHEAVSPRQCGPEDWDIGSFDDDWEQARLAHKLREDFKLTFQEVADFLNATDYATLTNRTFTQGNIKHLLGRHAGDFWSLRSCDLQHLGNASVHGIFIITYGADAENLKSAAEAYNATLSKPYKKVFAIPESPDAAGDGAECGGQGVAMRTLRTLLLLAGAEFAGGVYVSSADAFGSPTDRELAYAQLWQAGADVIVGGVRVDPENCVDPDTAALRRAARSGARLYRALRAHDRGTIIGHATTLQAAQALAQSLLDKGGTLEAVARRLNDEAIPTRKRVGRWSASAVSQLLNSAR